MAVVYTALYNTPTASRTPKPCPEFLPRSLPRLKLDASGLTLRTNFRFVVSLFSLCVCFACQELATECGSQSLNPNELGAVLKVLSLLAAELEVDTTGELSTVSGSMVLYGYGMVWYKENSSPWLGVGLGPGLRASVFVGWEGGGVEFRVEGNGVVSILKMRFGWWLL